MSVLQEDIDKAKIEIEEGNTTDRNSITELFKETYLVGINPKTGNDVYIKNKDLSYIIYKHVLTKEISYEELKNMDKCLNYDILALNDTPNGYRFYKKSDTRKGYYELATKVVNGEEIIHFQYMDIKYLEKKLKKIEKNGLILSKKV